MDKKLTELVQLDKEDTSIDFNISFRDPKTGNMIEKVPVVRVLIN